MNILDLPADPLVEIWAYLDGSDVVRFGMVCKRAQNISWSAVRELGIDKVDLLDYTLSQDLSNLRLLEISISYSGRHQGPEKFLAVLAKMPKLAEATNLRRLFLELNINDELPEMQSIADTLAQLTKLENLSVGFNHPRSKYDLGSAFKNHHNLTNLIVSTDKHWYGVDQLTQLKSLSIGEFDFKHIDQNLDEIATLTQLNELVLGDVRRVSKEKIGILSSLRNLESINIMDARSINFLLDLPKLSNLTLSLGYPGDCEEEIKIIDQLTNLTHLLVDAWNSTYLDVDQWTDLTNLQVLSLGGHIDQADFSNLANITQLVVLPRRSNYLILTNLPAHLQHLGLSSSIIFNEEIELIRNYSTLINLEVMAFDSDELLSMSKLSNLQSIWTERMTKEQIRVLRMALPSLKFLRVMDLEDDAVPELLLFTQLCSLGYKTIRGKEARAELHKAPFSILTESAPASKL